MKQYKQGIKKRRHERLRLLRDKKRKNATPMLSPQRYWENEPPAWSSLSEDYSLEHSSSQNRQTLKLIIKIICSLVLVTAVYMIMRSESPQIADQQHFIQEVMSRDFNVMGVMAWYEKNLGTEPAFLPKIIKREEEQELEPNLDYVVPVSGGLVISSFGQDQQGIMIKTADRSMPIEVVKEGWVVFVGEKEGLGQTIVIDHRNGEESWYGNLQDIQILLYDWVDQGEKIGYSSAIQEDSTQGIFYFALKKDSLFVDPLGVISFD